MSIQKPTAFVLMPFASEFDDIYSRFLHPVLTESGFEVKRADDLVSQQNILRDVIDGIVNRDLIVADLTSLNPNVFYEIGVAHALDKPVILITQNRNDTPFDLEQYRILEYSRDFASMEDAKDKLAEYARQFLQGDISFSNPVSDFRHVSVAPRKPSVVNTHNVADGDERGYLDHIVYLLEGYEGLAASLMTIVPYAEEVESKITAATEDLVVMAANLNSSTSRTVRDRFSRVAVDLGVFTTKLREVNDKYTAVTQDTQPSLQFTATFEAANAGAANIGTTEQISSLQEIQLQFITQRDQLISMTKDMDSLPSIEHHFDRELRLVIDEIRTLAGNFNNTIADISSVINKHINREI